MCKHIFRPHCGCTLFDRVSDVLRDKIMAEIVKQYSAPPLWLMPLVPLPLPTVFAFEPRGFYGYPSWRTFRRPGIGAIHVDTDPGDVDDGFLKRAATR